jgi:hypothetical protein
MLTTDWKTCPPCPDGVEAGWCADSDEILDFDCGTGTLPQTFKLSPGSSCGDANNTRS